ncbi:hypothetical protein VTN49DRAFT_4415 [Thermomyces lanuginosus]|uniref:uncharacterized protein n=1 Tax=Thermomyces lanuginosus TaxID=5541 RepID=UPI0037449BAE
MAGSQGGAGRGSQSSFPQSNAWTGSAPRDHGTTTGPVQEQHVPVRGFNAAEAKNALRNGPTQSTPVRYQPSGPPPRDGTANRASGPWAAKPNTMANGRDFFLELRKQVTALQNGGNVPGG